MPLTALARVVAFIKLGRPQFLVGGFLLYGLGVALSRVAGAEWSCSRYACGQVIVTATQWMTQYSNDYFDLEADRANATPTRWSGGSRVLTSGSIAPRAALIASLVLAGAALAATLYIALQPGTPRFVWPLAAVMLALSWSYSAPPLRLLARGLGELTTAVVVTLLTPLLGFYLQRGSLEALPFLACVPLMGLQFAMLLAIELPDLAGDRAEGKQTLVVRWGARWGTRACAGLVMASFVSVPILIACGLPPGVGLAALLLAPLALWHVVRLLRGGYEARENWESLALCAVALLAGTTLAELLGALAARGLG